MRRLLPLLLLAGCEPAADPRPAEKAASAAAPAPTPKDGVPDNGVVDRTQRGIAAPDARFLDGEGQATTLADFRGRPVLLNLWATWCAPCVAEMPTLDALAAREGDRLAVVTLSEDNDDETQTAAAKIDAFFTSRKLSRLGGYHDAESAVMTQLGVQVLPTTILYDAGGKEVWRVTGELDWTGARARQLLAEVG